MKKESKKSNNTKESKSNSANEKRSYLKRVEQDPPVEKLDPKIAKALKYTLKKHAKIWEELAKH